MDYDFNFYVSIFAYCKFNGIILIHSKNILSKKNFCFLLVAPHVYNNAIRTVSCMVASVVWGCVFCSWPGH